MTYEEGYSSSAYLRAFAISIALWCTSCVSSVEELPSVIRPVDEALRIRWEVIELGNGRSILQVRLRNVEEDTFLVRVDREIVYRIEGVIGERSSLCDSDEAGPILMSLESGELDVDECSIGRFAVLGPSSEVAIGVVLPDGFDFRELSGGPCDLKLEVDYVIRVMDAACRRLIREYRGSTSIQ